MKLKVFGLTFIALFTFTTSWSDNSYNLRVEEANCKSRNGGVTCYGSICEAGDSICMMNICSCGGGVQ